jgi:hypothetical protein
LTIVRTYNIDENHQWLDQEPAIVACEPNPALHVTPQNEQLMSERCILCLKLALRLEWRGQDGQYET